MPQPKPAVAFEFPWSTRTSPRPLVLFFGPKEQSLLTGFAKASGLAIKRTDLVPRRTQAFPRTTVMARAGSTEVHLMHASFFWSCCGASHFHVPELLGATPAAALGVIHLAEDAEDALAALRIARHVGLRRVLGWVDSPAHEARLREALAGIDPAWTDAPIVTGGITKKKEAAATFERVLTAAGEHLAPPLEEEQTVLVPLEVVGYGMRPGDMKASCHPHGRPIVGRAMEALTLAGAHPIEIAELDRGGFLFRLPRVPARDVIGFARPGAARATTDARVRTVGPARGSDGSLYAFGHAFLTHHLEDGALTPTPTALRKQPGLVVAPGAPVVLVHHNEPLSATLGHFEA